MRFIDKSTIVGLFLAICGIFAGLLLEGGKITQILQPTAAIIVLGGTIGAVMVEYPLPVILEAGVRLRDVFFHRYDDHEALVEEFVRYANQARRRGVVSLDGELDAIEDPILKNAMMLAVDGTQADEIDNIMQIKIDQLAEVEEQVPRVFESAGGFAPTIGIIGAVLGLVQVMQHLQNLDAVGKGIAVAFVATVYGVGSANIFFLPSAGKLRTRVRQQQMRRELILKGVRGIVEGTNPRLLQLTLLGFVHTARQQDAHGT